LTDDSSIRIAVVGHTNAGKTSLLRTLTRRVRFGEVSERPGTTRHVEKIALEVAGRAAVTFFDTPGLEDAVSLREHLEAFAAKAATPPDRIRAFLQGPEAHGVFEQEAKVLRAMLDVDAAFLVIDAREPVLPKFRAEIELLNSCARPVLPVLNFVRSDASREPAWRELLSAYGLHAVVRFDAAAPFVGAERELYQDLGTLLRDRREQLTRVVASLAAEAVQRRDAAAARIAELTVDVTALRRTVPSAEFNDPTRRLALIADLQAAVSTKTQRCADDLLALYGFREGDADEAPLPQLEGRWSMDFFSAEALKDAGLRLGKGAAVGAAVGAVADIAMAGLSLGTATALGATIGGALSQGFGPMGRKLMNLMNDVQELTVEDRVLFVLLDWLLALVRALEQRGHAATGRIAAGGLPQAGTPTQQQVEAIVDTAGPARGHPDWEAGLRNHWFAPAERRTLVDDVARSVRPAIETNT
jgi:GTPase Era involved in 16S rRNA processing